MRSLKGALKLRSLRSPLADLAEVPDRRLDVRLFSGGSVAFHPKAYIFWSSAGGPATGYVGRRTIPQTLSYPCTPRLREGSESCGRWAPGCCFDCGAFSAGPGGGGPDTFLVG